MFSACRFLSELKYYSFLISNLEKIICQFLSVYRYIFKPICKICWKSIVTQFYLLPDSVCISMHITINCNKSICHLVTLSSWSHFSECGIDNAVSYAILKPNNRTLEFCVFALLIINWSMKVKNKQFTKTC